MNNNDHAPVEARDEVPGLSGLVTPVPGDFAARVLQRVGISPETYDSYTVVDTAAGKLYVVASPAALTGAALVSAWPSRAAFESAHRRRTGRSAIGGTQPARGVLPALRTGRTRRLAIDLTGLSPDEQAVLTAVRAVPPRQLRPLSWIAREAGFGPDPDVGFIVRVLAGNPVAVLVPTYRVTYDDGSPCDLGYPAGAGEALRLAEGIDPSDVAGLLARGTRFMGSDTTRIFCHPTCSDARRITLAHRVPFGSAREARQAGYRECRRCRPVAA